jgi:glycosyltransferase involved in cell wall biosynthesis
VPAATVLIPTHSHIGTLRYAVESVRAQTLAAFELFIVADGVGDTMRALIAELAASDARIRVFDFPKGERKGERHRHAALQEATGRFVAYLGDDDVWAPNHLATMALLLDGADFANTNHVGINVEGRLFWMPSNIGDPAQRARMLAEPPSNPFDMTSAGHTLEAYRRLKIGWAPPVDCPWADLYVWRQFLAEPWCRARSAPFATGICTQTHQRPDLSDAERGRESQALLKLVSDPAAWRALWRDLSRALKPQVTGVGSAGTPFQPVLTLGNAPTRL